MDKLDVLTASAEILDCPVAWLTSKSRKYERMDAKRIVQWTLRYQYKMTLRDIGDIFNGLHHASVLHNIQTLNDYMDVDKDLREKVAAFVMQMRERFPLRSPVPPPHMEWVQQMQREKKVLQEEISRLVAEFELRNACNVGIKKTDINKEFDGTPGFLYQVEIYL